MEEILTQLIQSQGVWAVLFVFLLLYTIKKNDKLDELQDAREKEYRELLLELTEKFSVVNEINSKLDTLCTMRFAGQGIISQGAAFWRFIWENPYSRCAF